MDELRAWPSPLVCSICTRSFGRREHLARHTRIHTREKPFSCATCGKEFSRQDVLSRHVASHNNQSATPPMPRISSRACEHCATGRVRCSRQQPCQRCSKRQLACRYPTTRNRLARSGAQSEAPDRVPRTEETQNVLDLRGTEQAAAVDMADSRVLDRILEPHDTEWMRSLGDNGVGPSHHALHNFTQPALGLSDINWMSPQGYTAIDWETQLADFLRQRNYTNLDGSFPFFLGQVPGSQEEGELYKLSGDAGTTRALPVGQEPATEAVQRHADSRPPSSTEGSKHSTSAEGRYYVDGSGARAPFGGKSKRRYSIANMYILDHRDSVEPSTSPSADILVSLDSYNAMLEGVQIESGQQPLRSELLHLPSYAQTLFYVRQYFDNFHPVFPFLRRSTFLQDISQDWILLLAVTAVGSRYTRRVQGPQPSAFLLDILRKILRRQTYGLDIGGDVSVPFTPGSHLDGQGTSLRIQTLQAGSLAVLCMLHSGKKAYMDFAFLDRHYLVEACNKLGLLSSKSRNDVNPQKTGIEGDTTVAWAQRESEIRTGMMIWLLDSMVHYEFDEKPLMSLSEAQNLMPVNEESWDVSDSTQPSHEKDRSVTFPEAMDMLYMEKRIPSNFGEFSIAIMIHAICRKTREVIAWEQGRLNSWTPTASPRPRPRLSSEESWLPDTTTTSRWRNSACDCLDVLHWSANGKAAMLSGSEHHNILLLHLSRLILLTPTRHIQTLATASSSRQDSQFLGTGRNAIARDQVLQWVVRDQYKARLCIVHCGALFWHVRRHSCDSFLEPYAIYIAILVLWAFSASTQFVGPDAISSYAHCKIPSMVSTSTPATGTAGADSYSEDASVPSFFHLDRPLDDELVQEYVRTGYRMSAFVMGVGNIQDTNAPVKILQEGIRLLERGPQTEHGPGQVNTRGLPENGQYYTWGIEGSYIESLRQMVKASER